MAELRDAARQALEALESLFTLQADDARPKRCGDAITALKAALEQPEQEPELRELLIGAAAMAVAAERKGEYQGASWVADAVLEQPEQTCNCRWVGDVQTQQCTLHEAHVDAIHEWAERAKAAEAKLAALEQLEPPPEAQTEAEKIAYCAGWWAAMEQKREQPEQEPVYWEYKHVDDGLERWNRVVPRTGQTLETAAAEIHGYRRGLKRPYEVRALYTHPPRREWRSLSEEEVFHVENNVPDSVISDRQWTVYFASAIEAALRSKNYD